MEDLAAEMRELALSIGSVKATVDKSQSLLREIVAWKPQEDGSLQEMRSDNTLLQQPGRAALGGSVSATVAFGSRSTIGGMDAVASSLSPIDPATEKGRRAALTCHQQMATRSTRSVHPWASPSISELDANYVEDSIDLNTTLPTRCSMHCSIANKDDVQAEDAYMESTFASTTIPVPVGVSMSLLAQQIGILKPDKHTSTTCSTDALDIDTDSMRAKRDTNFLPAGLVSTSASASAVLSATTPPHPPDQPVLLLDRPPPWPLRDSLISMLLQMVDKLFKLPCDPGIHIFMTAEIITKRSDDGPIFINGSVEQADYRIYHLDNLYSCSMQHFMIFVLLNQGKEISKDISFSAASVLFQSPNILYYHVFPDVSTVAYEGIFPWWLQHTSCLIVGMITGLDLRLKHEYTCATVDKKIQSGNASNIQLQPSDLGKVSDSHKIELHQEVRPNLFSGLSTSSSTGCSNFSGISMTATFLVFLHLTHLSAAVHSMAETMFANLSAAGAACEIPLPRPFYDVVPFCGDHIGNLVMLSDCNMTILDPGVNGHMIWEVVLPELAQQALREIWITPCNSCAHRQCTLTLYWNHFGAHHNCDAYNFLGGTLLAGVMCKTNDCGVILEGALHELIPLIKIVLGGYAQYMRVEHQEELLIELSEQRQGFPQVHPVNDHRAQFILVLITRPNHDDQVCCMDNSSLSLPWDPGKLLCLELWFTHPTSKQLRQSSSSKLHRLPVDVHRLWDPGGSSRRPAWGQAGFQGGGNVTDWILRWAAVSLGWSLGPDWWRVAIKWQVLEQRKGVDEQTTEPVSPLSGPYL